MTTRGIFLIIFPMMPSTPTRGLNAATVVNTAKMTGRCHFLGSFNGSFQSLAVPRLMREDVLTHDDGVIHHDAENHDEGKKRNHVDRNIQPGKKPESTQERDGNSQG